jgi:hypothetical protein
MAEKIVRTLVDDIDGTEATHTRRFSLDGKNYRIDLSEKNNEKLEKALTQFIAHAVSDGATSAKAKGTARRANREFDPSAVRAWAEANGIAVSSRGRIPQTLLEQYKSAN